MNLNELSEAIAEEVLKDVADMKSMILCCEDYCLPEDIKNCLAGQRDILPIVSALIKRRFSEWLEKYFAEQMRKKEFAYVNAETREGCLMMGARITECAAISNDLEEK